MIERARIPRPPTSLGAVCSGLAVMLLAGLVYSPLLTADFVDANDRHYVAAGRNWAGFYSHSEWLTRGKWKHAADVLKRGGLHRPDGTGGYFQPLVTVSLMIDAILTRDWHAARFQFHLSNLLLHVMNVGLVFMLVRSLFGRGAVWPALLALLFALHPAQVESVAWVSQRMTLLGGLFTLLALNAYVAYVRTRRLRWMLLVLAAYAAALLCRPLFIALPVVLLVLDLGPLRRQGRDPLVEKLPLFGMMILAATLQMWVRSIARPIHGSGVEGVALLARNGAALAGRLLWPTGLPPYRPLASHGMLTGVWFDVGICLLVAGALVGSFRRSRPLFAALAGSMLLVLPALLQAPFSDRLLSDQYLYAALVVPILVAAGWIRDAGMKAPAWRRGSGLALGAVLVMFAVQSYGQTFSWQSGRELFLQTRARYPDWAFGYIGLVESYIRENDLDAALQAAETAATIEPENPSSQYYLGTVLLLHRDGRSAEAIELLKRALASDPDWIECLQKLGGALAKNGRTDEAIAYLERARDLDPHAPEIRLELGSAYLKVHRFASARGEFQEALRQRNNPAAHLGLAIAWAANDRPDYARRHLAAAVAKDPRFALRAGRSSELLRYRDHPGFGGLMQIPEDAGEPQAGPVIESPAATQARGS